MADRHAPDERPLGTRYRIDEADGTWWELGWDRPLATFYAQHYDAVPFDPFTPDNLLAWHGTMLGEFPTVEALVAHVPVSVPGDVLTELALDAEAHPHLVDPPFGYVAQAVEEALGLSGPEPPPDPLARPSDPSPPTPPGSGGEQRSLPAQPLALALLRLCDELGGDDLATFSRGLGLDPELCAGVLNGRVDKLGIEQVGEVCEALRCSPYEVWGPAAWGREILAASGPEPWAALEPPNEGGPVAGDDGFAPRRLEHQADGAPPAGEAAPGSVVLEITRYRQTAVLALDAEGRVTRVEDTLRPAEAAEEYHFAYRQLGGAHQVVAPMTVASFSDGCPPGRDAAPVLVALADAIDRLGMGADMMRFVEASSGAEQWLGRETPFDAWQTWDDPRRHYPCDPTDVLVSPDDLAAGVHRLPLDAVDGIGDVATADTVPELDSFGIDL